MKKPREAAQQGDFGGIKPQPASEQYTPPRGRAQHLLYSD